MSTTDNSQDFSLSALQGFPLVENGDDIGSLIVEGILANNLTVKDGLVIVIAQKIVSKAEGRAIRLDSVTPGKEATVLAGKTGKDARLIELILAESNEVVRQSNNLIITENKLGIVMANAGIDQSNIDDGYALLLPENPDDSAAKIGQQIGGILGFEVGIVIADSAGRPWRKGVVGIAIGAYGIPAILDVKGSTDLNGRELLATEIGVADGIAAAATLIMGQGSEGNPVILVSGLSYDAPFSTATDILRDKESDLFR